MVAQVHWIRKLNADENLQKLEKFLYAHAEYHFLTKLSEINPVIEILEATWGSTR